MAKFVTIGERLSTTAPAVNKAFTERDPEPIIKRAKQQLDAGATYLDVNIGRGCDADSLIQNSRFLRYLYVEKSKDPMAITPSGLLSFQDESV